MKTITADVYELRFTDEQYEQALDYWRQARYAGVDYHARPTDEEQAYKFNSDMEFKVIDRMDDDPEAGDITIGYRVPYEDESKFVKVSFDRVGDYLTVTAVRAFVEST